MKRDYIYFISYVTTNKDCFTSVYGMAELKTDEPIKNFSDIQKISEQIKEKMQITDEVVILNYKLMEVKTLWKLLKKS